MHVYIPNKRNHVVFVAPGAEHPDASQWVHEDGRPITFRVEFKDGRASVDNNMGAYLIEKKYAQRTPLFLPFATLMKGAPPAVTPL